METLNFETPTTLRGGKKCIGVTIYEPFDNPEDVFVMKPLYSDSEGGVFRIPIHKISQLIAILEEIRLRGVKDGEEPPF